MIVARETRLAAACALAGCALLALPAVARGRGRRAAALPGWAAEALARPSPRTGADAVWLHRELVVRPLGEGGVRRTFRAAVRILRPDGLRAFGSCSVGYRREDRVERLDAWSVGPGGELRGSRTVRDASDEPFIASGSVYDDWRIRSVEVPALMVGGVVVWESEWVTRLDVGAASLTLATTDRPVALGRLEVEVPEGWQWQALTRRAEGVERAETERGVVLLARDLDPVIPERHGPPEGDVLPLAWVRWWSEGQGRGFPDWDAVGRWYHDLSEPVLEDLGDAALVAERLKPAGPEGWLDSLGAAYDFVAREIRYVSIQIGVGGFRPYSPAEVCRKRFGDCKDKSFLIRALAAAWGAKAYPVLVRTAGSGELEREVPSPGQFDHCIAAIRLPEGVGDELWSTSQVEGLGRLVFLDATVREGGPWDLRRDVQGTLGLLVHEGGGTLVELPVQPPSAALTRRSLRARLSESGELSEATLTESWTGTAAARVRSFYSGKTAEERRRDVATDLQGRFGGASLASWEVRGLDDAGEVTEVTVFRGGRLGNRVGDLLIVEPGSAGHGVVRMTLAPPPRRWSLLPGNPRREELEVILELPERLVVEELPDPFELETAELRASGAWEVEAGRLIYRRDAELETPRVDAARYEAFRDAVGRLAGADARAVVLVPR